MKQKKHQRRLLHLMGVLFPDCRMHFQMRLEAGYYERISYYKSDVEKYTELWQLVDKLKIENDTVMYMWKNIRHLQRARHGEYTVKPIPVKKDNFNTYNEEPPRLSGTRRYPRRKRKTAWKRFYKLFPDLKP